MANRTEVKELSIKILLCLASSPDYIDGLSKNPRETSQAVMRAMSDAAITQADMFLSLFDSFYKGED